MTTAPPKVLATALRAWNSLFQALPRMALLFIVGYALLAGLDVGIDRLSHLLSLPTRDALKAIITENGRLPWPGVLKAIGVDVAVWILRAIIAAPLAVAMHRFILLGETRRFYFLSRLTLRFAVWIFVLQSLVLILWWLILFAAAATGLVPLLFVLLIALALFLMQTLQLFPAVAVEEPSDSLSSRLETALERAEGMFWRTLGILLLALLPLGLARLIAIRLFAKLAQRVPLTVPLGRAAWGFLLVVLGAAVISFLYSYGAHKKQAQLQAEGTQAPSRAG